MALIDTDSINNFCEASHMTADHEAYPIYLHARAIIDSDDVDGKSSIFRKIFVELRKMIYRMKAKGIEYSEDCCKISCSCVVFNSFFVMKREMNAMSVPTNDVSCTCCNVKKCESVCNIFKTALAQIEAIDRRTMSPLMSRLNRKINVLVNVLRQLMPFACAPCLCNKHSEDDECMCGVARKKQILEQLRDTNVYGCSGVERMDIKESTNVTFVDQREEVRDTGYINGDVATPSNIGLSMSEENWNLIQLLKKPTPIGSYKWEKDQTTNLTSLSIPGDLLVGVFSSIAEMFNYLRGSVVLRLQVNGTKFHMGRLIAYVLPFPRISAEVGCYPVDNATSMPHVMLDASLNNSGILKIPFSHILSYFNTNDTDSDQRIGQLYVVPFNKLQCADKAAKVLTLTIWAHLEDVELHQPYVHKNLLPKGAVPSGTAGVEKVMKNISGVANGIASAVSLIGNLDKPIRTKALERVVLSAIPDHTHGKGVDQSTRLSLLPQAVVRSTPQFVTAVDSDMDILTIAKQKTRLKTIEWKSSDPAGKCIFACPVAPNVYTKMDSGQGYDKFQLTNLAYCARPFCLWNGSMEVSLDIVSTAMHSGRLLLVMVAGETKNVNIGIGNVMNAGMLTCDLAEGKIFSARLPFMSNTPWKRCDKLISPIDVASEQCAVGMLYLFVMNVLANPVGVPAVVEVNFMIGAADDFQLAVPSDLTGFLSNNVVPPLERVFGAPSVKNPVKATGSIVTRVPITSGVTPPDGSFQPRSGVLPEHKLERHKPKFASATEGFDIDNAGPIESTEEGDSLLVADENTRVDLGLKVDGVKFWSLPYKSLAQHRFIESNRVYDNVDYHGYYVDVDTGDLWTMNVSALFRSGMVHAQAPTVGVIPKEQEEIVEYSSFVRRMSHNPRILASFNVDKWYLIDKTQKVFYDVSAMSSKGITVRHPYTYVNDNAFKSVYEFLNYHKLGTMPYGTFARAVGRPGVIGTAGVHIEDGRTSAKATSLALGNVYAKAISSLTTTENATDMQTVLRRQYPVALMKLQIPNTDITNIPYIQFPVTPMLQRSNRVLKQTQLDDKQKETNVEIGAEAYSHVNHFGSVFTFYRGAQRVKFLFGQSENPDITIIVVYRPNVACTSDYGKVSYVKAENMLATLEYASVLYQGRLQASIEVEMPFVSRYGQISLANAITSGIHDLRSSVGTLQVFFLGIKDVLSQQIMVFSALGDDAMFSYMRAAPHLYIRKGVEAQRDLSDSAQIVDFSLGTSASPAEVPVGTMGLFSLYDDISTTANTMRRSMPDFEKTMENMRGITDFLSGILKKLSDPLSAMAITLDVFNFSFSCTVLLTMELTFWERAMHIAAIVLNLSTRCGVHLVLDKVLGFVFDVFNHIAGWWPKVRNTPMGSSGIDCSPFVPICAAMIGLVCNKALPTDSLNSICKDVLPCFRLINEGTRAVNNITSWIHPFLGVLKKYASIALSKVFPGIAQWLRITDRVDEIVEWMNEIDAIDPEAVPRLASEDMQYRHKIYLLRDKAVEYTRHIATGDDKYIASMVREYSRKIIKIANELNMIMDTPISRVDPFSICLVGDSGLGKSTLVPRIIYPLLDKMGYAQYNRVYARNSSDKFWSRYKGELVTVMDDYDQTEESPAITELIDIKTNNILQLTHGSEEKKGLLFMSEFLVLTTNTEYPTRNWIAATKKKAWWRRRNVLIWVERNPFDFDSENFSHLWFRAMHPFEPDEPKGPIMNLEELQQFIYDQAVPYMANQYEIVRRNALMAQGIYSSSGVTVEPIPVRYDSDDEGEDEEDEEVSDTFVDAHEVCGTAGNERFIDVDRVVDAEFYAWFDADLYPTLRAIYNKGTGEYDWICDSLDPHILGEWRSMCGMYTNLNIILKPYVRVSMCDRVKQWRDKVCEVGNQAWEFIQKHPVLVASVTISALLLGVWKFKSTANAAVAMSSVYNVGVNGKVARAHVMAMSGEVDKHCNELVEKRVVPHIYRITVDCPNGTTYAQNAFAIGKRWIVTVKHLFTEQFRRKQDHVKFNLKYGNCWMGFIVEQSKMRYDDKYDLIFLELDSRFNEHRSNMEHFVDESDLDKLSEFEGVYVGGYSSVDVTVTPIKGKPLKEQKYLDPFTGDVIQIYKAWKYPGVTQTSTCGGVILVQNTHIRAKIIGIHVAADRQDGYAHVVTKQMIQRFVSRQETHSLGIPCPPVIGPLPSTFPDGHFGYIGITDKSVGAVNRTELVPSLVQGRIGPVETAPSVLSSNDCRLKVKCSPMYNAIVKLGVPSAGFNQSVIEHICKVMSNRLSILDKKYARVLSDEEMITGVPGVEHLDRINMATSAGYPYTRLDEAKKGKLWLLNDEGTAMQHPLLISNFEKRHSNAKEGLRVESVWVDCLKDEKRPIKKIEEGNTRLFQIPPLDFTLLYRKYFLGFIAACMEKRHYLASQVGINPYGPDWTRLYERLTSHSCYYYCGDYKNFDRSTLPQIVSAFVDCVNHYYGSQPGTEDANVRKVLEEELNHTVHIVINKLYSSRHGNPSGNPGTTSVNGFVNEAYIILAWILLHIEAGIVTTAEEFYEYVELIVFGDDNIISVKREKTHIFNPDAISAVMHKYLGVTYTSGSKDKEGGQFIGIDDVVFLKNKFKLRENDSFRYWAALDPDTIREMCNWVRGANKREEGTIENANNSCRFAYFHGREFYDKWVSNLRDAFKEIDVVWIPPSFEGYDLWFLSQFEDLGEDLLSVP